MLVTGCGAAGMGAEGRVEQEYSVVQTLCAVLFQVTGSTVSHYLDVYV